MPRGWVEEPHACHRLAEAATGDLLLFVDADTQLTTDGLNRIVNLLRNQGLDGQRTDMVTMPHKRFKALHRTAHDAHAAPDLLCMAPTYIQVVSVSLHACCKRTGHGHPGICYSDIGGFEAVKNDIVDDMAMPTG